MTAFGGILQSHGDEALLYSDTGTESARVFIQPLMGNRLKERWSDMTVLGRRDGRRYRCFSDKKLPVDGYMICDGVSYDVLISERFKVMGQVSHWESVLEKRAPEY